MPLGIKFHRKPWERVLCTFELQEFRSGEKGWHSITDPTGEIPSKPVASEFFKPGNHYRVIARAIEDKGEFKAGSYVGVVWEHYEPTKGFKPPPVEKEKEKPSRPKDATEAMKEYVGEVRRVLEPITDIFTAMNELRDSLFPEGETSRSTSSSSEGGSYSIPPPEFDGKLPVIMHPFVIHTIAEEVKGVIEYGATRLEGIMGKGPPAGAPPTEEEEEPLLPSITSFAKPKLEEAEKPEEPEGPEEKEIEERVEEEEGVEEEEEAEELPSEEEVETVPSLIGKKCANCGRVVPLLPSGLCESCAKKLAKEAEEHERELEEEESAGE